MAKGKAATGSTDGPNGKKRRAPRAGRKRAGMDGINRPVLELVEELMVEGRLDGEASEAIAKKIAKAVNPPVSVRQAQRYMGQVYAKWDEEAENDPNFRKARRSWIREMLDRAALMALGEEDSCNVFVEGHGPGLSSTVYSEGPKTDLKALSAIVKDLMRLDGLEKPIKVEHSGEVTGVLVVPGQRVAV